jgi:hypothetical protein
VNFPMLSLREAVKNIDNLLEASIS